MLVDEPEEMTLKVYKRLHGLLQYYMVSYLTTTMFHSRAAEIKH